MAVHSTTNCLNGHSDVVGGAVGGPARNVAMVHRIQSMNNLLGTSQGRHDCFLILRGLRTLRWFTLAESLGAWRAWSPARPR